MSKKLLSRLLSFTMSATVALTSGVPALAYDGGGDDLLEVEDEELLEIEDEIQLDDAGADLDASEAVVEDEFFATEDEAEFESAGDVGIKFVLPDTDLATSNMEGLYNIGHGDVPSAGGDIGFTGVNSAVQAVDSVFDYSIIVQPVDGFTWNDGKLISAIGYTDYSEKATNTSGTAKTITGTELDAFYTVSDYTAGGRFAVGTKKITFPSSSLTTVLGKYTALDGKKARANDITVTLNKALAAKYTLKLGPGINISNKSVTDEFLTGDTQTSISGANALDISQLVTLGNLDKDKIIVRVNVSAGNNGKAVERSIGVVDTSALAAIAGETGISDIQDSDWKTDNWIELFKDSTVYKLQIHNTAYLAAYLEGREITVTFDASEAGAAEKFAITKGAETYVTYKGTNSSTDLPEEGVVTGSTFKFTPVAKNASAGGTRKVKKVWYTMNGKETVVVKDAAAASYTATVDAVTGPITIGATTTESASATITTPGDVENKAAVYDTKGVAIASCRPETGLPFSFVVRVNGKYSVKTVTYSIGNREGLVPTVSGDVYTTESITDTLKIQVTLQQEANEYTVISAGDTENINVLAVNGESTEESGNVISTSTASTKGKATAGKAFYFTAVPKVAASYSIKAVTYSMTPEGGTASTGLVPELVDKTSGLYKIPTVTGPIVLNFTVVGATSVTAPANSSVEVNFTTGNYSIGEDFAFTISGKTDNVTVGTVMYYPAKDNSDKAYGAEGYNAAPVILGEGAKTYTILKADLAAANGGVIIYATSRTVVDPTTYKAEFVADSENAYTGTDTKLVNTYSSTTIKDFQTLTGQTLNLVVGEEAVMVGSKSGFSTKKTSGSWNATTKVATTNFTFKAPEGDTTVTIDNENGKLTGKKAGSVTLTGTYMVADIEGKGNYLVYTADLPVVVTDKYTDFALDVDVEGVQADGASAATFTVSALNGRTGKAQAITYNKAATTRDEVKSVKFTIRDYNETAASKEYWMNSVTTDDDDVQDDADAADKTGIRIIDSETVNQNAKLYASKAQSSPVTIDALITLGDDSTVTVSNSVYVVKAQAQRKITVVPMVEITDGAQQAVYADYTNNGAKIALASSGTTQKTATITYKVFEDAVYKSTESEGATYKALHAADPIKALNKAIADGDILDITSQAVFADDDELIQVSTTDAAYAGYEVSKKTDPVNHISVSKGAANGVYTVEAFNKSANNFRFNPTIYVDHIQQTGKQVVFTVRDLSQKVTVKFATINNANTAKQYINELSSAYKTGKGKVSEVIDLDSAHTLSYGKLTGYEFTEIEVGSVITLPTESDFSTPIESKKALAGFIVGSDVVNSTTYLLPGAKYTVAAGETFTALWVDKYGTLSLQNALLPTEKEDTDTKEKYIEYDTAFKNQSLKVGASVPLALRVKKLKGIKAAPGVKPAALKEEHFDYVSTDILTGFTLAKAAETTAYDIDGTTIKAKADNGSASLQVKGTYADPDKPTDVFDIETTAFTVTGERDYKLTLTASSTEVEAGTAPVTITAVYKDGTTDLSATLDSAATYVREWTVDSAAGTIKSDWNGTNAGGKTAQFTPVSKADKVTVTLKVTDKDGISVSKSIDLKVTEAKVKIEVAENNTAKTAITSIDALANQSAGAGTKVLVRAINTETNATITNGGSWSLADSETTEKAVAKGVGGAGVITSTEGGYRIVAINTQDDTEAGQITIKYTAASGVTYQTSIPVTTYYSVRLNGVPGSYYFVTKDGVPVKNANYSAGTVDVKVTKENQFKVGNTVFYGPISLSDYSAVKLSGNAADATVKDDKAFDYWADSSTGKYTTSIEKIAKSIFTAGTGVYALTATMKDTDASLSGVPATITIDNTEKLGNDLFYTVEAGVRPVSTAADLLVTADDIEFFSIFAGNLAYNWSTTQSNTSSATAYKQGNAFDGDAVKATTVKTPSTNPTSRTDTFSVGSVANRAGKTTLKIYSVNSAGSIGANDVPVKTIVLNVNGLDIGAKATTYWENGELVKSDMRKVGSKTYYFDENGEAITSAGIHVINGKKVLFLTNGNVSPKGIQDYKDYSYYVGENGEILSGWITSTGTVTTDPAAGVYYADPDKDDVLADGFYKVGSDYYAFKTNVKQTAKAGTEGYVAVDLGNKVVRYVDTEGKAAVAKIGVVGGVNRLFREDGSIVSYADADVVNGKITVAGIGYVIKSDDSAELDDVFYNAKVNWTQKFPSKYTKGTTLPEIQYTITYTSKNTGKSTTTEVKNAVVTSDGDYSATSTATQLTFTATPDLTGYWKTADAKEAATAAPITETYKFKNGGLEGTTGQEIGGEMMVEGLEEEYFYTGQAIKPVITVTDGDVVLAQGVDYTVQYKNNTKISSKSGDEYTPTAQVIVKGKGNYDGQGQTLSFAIVDPKDKVEEDDVDLTGYKVAVPKEDLFYTGEYVYPSAIILTPKGGTATTYEHQGDGDYGDLPAVVSFSNNVKKGTAKLTLTGKAKANGKTKVLNKTFTIKAVDMEANAKNFTVDVAESAAWAKNGAKPDVKVTWEGYELVPGQDYTLAWSKNKKVGAAKVTVKGKGNFSKKIESSFTVTALPLAEEMVAAVSAIEGKKGAKVTLLDGEGTVIPTSLYTVSVFDGETAVTDKLVAEKDYTIKIAKKAGKTELGDEPIEITAQAGLNIGVAKINAKEVVKTYTGEAITLTDEDIAKIAVTYKKTTTLVAGTDFEITGYTNNIKKGNMTVTIKGIGKYSGVKTFKVKIAPKPINKATN